LCLRASRRPVRVWVWSAPFALAALAVGLAAHPARAFCREVTESPPAGYDPTVNGCFAPGTGTFPPLYWRNWCVGYDLQRNGSQYFSMAQVRAAAQQAFQMWETAQCPDMVVGGVDMGSGPPAIFVSELEPVSCDQAPSREHNNPILFRDTGWPYTDTQNALGYTTLTVDLATGEILGAAIEINTSPGHTIVATSPPPAGAYDLPSILTHEAGHFLGLAHSETRDAVMFALYQPGSTTLQPDDVQGICSIYLPSGSRNSQQGLLAATSCNPAPRLGFRDDCGSIDSGTPNDGIAVEAPVGATTPLAEGGAPILDSDEGGATADAGPLTDNLFGCSVSGGRASRPAGRTAGFATLALLWRRRARLRGRTNRRGRMPLSCFRRLGSGVLAACLVAVCVPRIGRASVSIPVTFDDLIRRSSAVAIVVATEQHGTWESGRIVTYSRLRVDRLIAGILPPELWVRTMGGAVSPVRQLVEGEATFAVGGSSLVFVHPHADGSTPANFGVVEGAQGQFALIESSAKTRRIAAAPGLGGLTEPSRSARLALDVLVGRSLDDAARFIARAWTRKRRVDVLVP
jgi:hypothetical protein